MATTGRAPDTILRKAFGARVHEHRRQLGISQEELAHRARLDRTYISSIERGQRNVALENICQLADALEVDPGTLLTGLKRTGPSVTN